jgi:hypothetical protein
MDAVHSSEVPLKLHGGISQKMASFIQGVSESSWTVTVVTASVKEDERGGQGHTSTSLCISLPHDTVL